MTRPSGWPAAALWGALAVVGQAGALSLVAVGGVGYQHYPPVSDLLSHPVSVALIVLQGVAVAWGLHGALRSLLMSARRVLPGWRLGAFTLAMFLSSATVGRELPRYIGELFVSSVIQLVGLATIVLAVRAIPDSALGALRGRFDRLLGDEVAGGQDVRPRVDRFAVVVAIAVTALCALLSVVVYGRHPHLQDEVAYLFQARTFASGRIALPMPPVPRAFELYLIDTGPKGWYSPVPPGWGLILALGVPVTPEAASLTAVLRRPGAVRCGPRPPRRPAGSARDAASDRPRSTPPPPEAPPDTDTPPPCLRMQRAARRM